MRNPIMKHVDELTSVASTNALASEFIADAPKSIALCHLVMGIASTTMTEEQMQALHSELEPVIARMVDELKNIVNKHDVSFSGQGAALMARAKFPSEEDKANFQRDLLPIIALKMMVSEAEQVARTAGEATGSFEA